MPKPPPKCIPPPPPIIYTPLAFAERLAKVCTPRCTFSGGGALMNRSGYALLQTNGHLTVFVTASVCSSMPNNRMDKSWQSMHGALGSAEWPGPKVVATSSVANRADQGNTIKADEYMDDPSTLDHKIGLMADLVKQSRCCVAYTGAGLSKASGIPDYGTKAENSVVKVAKIGNSLDAKPTYAHYVLAAMEKVCLQSSFKGQSTEVVGWLQAVDRAAQAHLRGRFCEDAFARSAHAVQSFGWRPSPLPPLRNDCFVPRLPPRPKLRFVTQPSYPRACPTTSPWSNGPLLR